MSIALAVRSDCGVTRTTLATASLGAAIDAALRALRDRGRRAIRIVDLESRSGKRLIRVARRARAFGFLAIEARGCARSPLAAQAARRAAAALHDPAIGWRFDVTAAEPGLAEEEDGADIILLSARALAGGSIDGEQRLVRALLDVTDDTLMITTPPAAAAHLSDLLSDAMKHPGARGAAHPARRAVLVGPAMTAHRDAR